MTQYKLSPDVDLQDVDNKLIVLDLRNNAYYSINSSGGFFLKKISECRSEAEILDEAEARFDGADRTMLQDDLHAFIHKMLDLGIIQMNEGCI
ncbi:MAG: PqqD family protein [Proteobacteria bacterium]|nr:PqqD family protein [Pseudomonadota bacterium]